MRETSPPFLGRGGRSRTDRPAGLPRPTRDSAVVGRALWVAVAAHSGPSRGEKRPAHPLAVADLIASYGFDENVVAAALLHDTVEDTDLTIEDIQDGFGEVVAALVAGVTEDPSIHPYVARKAEARGRMIRDERTAAIYAADKLVSVEALLAAGVPIDEERLDHFTKTLRFLSEGRPDLPFLPELATALALLTDREVGRAPIPETTDRGGSR
jgi:(p)ppGpp synthase/HD superfamily hydrolase